MNQAGDGIAVLLEQLKSLRKGAGLNDYKLRHAPELQGALAAHGKFKPGEISVGIRYLERQLKLLGGSHALAALNALGLDEETDESLTVRRKNFAGRMGRLSTDTIENWENDGFRQLAVILLDQLSQGMPASEPTRPSNDAKSTVLFVDRVSRYEGRLLREVNISRKIRAEVDGRDVRTIKFRLPTDPKAVAVEAVSGCTVESSEWRSDGTLASKVKLSKILNRDDDPHTYKVRYVVTTDKPCDPRIVYSVPPRSWLKELFIQAQFTGNPLPTKVWWRENRTGMQASSDLPGELLFLDQNGYVQHTFTNLTPGLCQVVAWEWPDD